MAGFLSSPRALMQVGRPKMTPAARQRPGVWPVPWKGTDMSDRTAMYGGRRYQDANLGCLQGECEGESVPGSPVSLCREHLREAWAYVALDLERAGYAALRRFTASGFSAAPPAPPKAPKVTDGFVYFVRLSDRIKIGWTHDFAKRGKQLSYDEVLHVEAGTRADEQRCHLAFVHLRTCGEWFQAEPELLAFIGDLKRKAA